MMREIILASHGALAAGMADTALTLLMRRIENLDDEFFPQTVNVGYKLIERESTAA